jgi:plasmid stabilization system protein ParE
MELRWTEEAAADPEHITDYLFQNAPERAAELVRRIYNAPAAKRSRMPETRIRGPRMHGRPPHFPCPTVTRFSRLLLIPPRLLAWRPNGEGDEAPIAGQSAVAALSERRNPLRVQDRRSETAATRNKLTTTEAPGARMIGELCRLRRSERAAECVKMPHSYARSYMPRDSSNPLKNIGTRCRKGRTLQEK